MAIFRDSKVTTTEGVADTTLEASLPVYKENDWLFFILCTANATVSTAPTGYTLVLNQIAGTITRCVIYKKKASASESKPSVTISTPLTMSVIVLSIQDADETDSVDDVQYSLDSGATTAHTIPAVTSTVDGAMILDILALSAISSIGVDPSIPRQLLDRATVDRHISVRAMGQVSAGTVASETLNSSASIRGMGIRIAIKNKSGGRRATVCTGGPNVIALGGAGHPISSVTDLSTIRASFASANTNALLSLVITNQITLSTMNTFGLATRITLAPANAGVGLWYGFYFDVASADMSGLVSLGFVDAFASAQMLFSSISVYLEDGSGNWSLRYFGHQTTGPRFLHLDDLTVVDSSGTLDKTDIVRIGHAFKHNNTSTSVRTVDIAGIASYLTPYVYTGYVRPRSMARFIAGLGIKNIASSQGELQDVIGCSVQIGDGTNPMEYNGESSSTEMPFAIAGYDLDPLDLTVTVKAASGDTVAFDQSIMSGADQFNFVIDANSSTGATYSGNSSILRGSLPVWKTGITATGRAFLECGTVDGKGAIFTECSFAKGTGTTAALKLTNGGDAIDCTFAKGTETYAIELQEAGAYDLSGSTFSGYTNQLYISAASGELTITLADGQDQPDYVLAGGSTATVTFDQAVLGTSYTNTALSDGTTILVRNITTSTTIDYVASLATGSGYTINLIPGVDYTAGDVIQLWFSRKDGTTYYQERTYEINTTAGGGDFSQVTDLDVCPICTAFNKDGVDYEDQYSMDLIDDEVDIDISGPWRTDELMVYIKYCMTIQALMETFWGVWTVEDDGSLLNHSDVLSSRLDNTSGNDAIEQTNRPVRRSDGARPIKSPTTSGYTVDCEWRVPVSIVATGSGVLPADIVAIGQEVWDNHVSGVAVDTRTARVDALLENVTGDRFTAKALEQAPSSSGSGATLEEIEGSTVLAKEATVASRLAAVNYTAPDNAGVAAIKAKTDNLPAAPAAVGDIPSAADNATATRTELSTELSRIDENISAAKTLTAAYDAAKTAASTGDIPTAAANASATRQELSLELSRIDDKISKVNWLL